MNECNAQTQFKGVKSISDEFLLNILESNFKMFFDWSFLKIGAWLDAKQPVDGSIFGNNNPSYKLILVDDPSYDAGSVWQGLRTDWVWENGIDYNGNSPIVIDSISINGNILDSGFIIEIKQDYRNILAKSYTLTAV